MNEKRNTKEYCGFNLTWVLIIVVITSVISALTTGAIIYNNNKINPNLNKIDLANDEDLNQFLEVYANILSEYYEDIDRKELLERAISGMMNYLGDDYTTYLDTTDTNELVDSLSGEYKGIGVSINTNDKVITKVYENTPAYKVGIKEGDRIVAFNGEDVTNLSTNEVVAMIKENNNAFTLTVIRGEEQLNFTLTSETIISPSVTYNMLENTNIGYMAISTFSRTLDTQMQKALKNLESQNMSSLIIDLRDNTGGYLDIANKVASMFLEKGKTIYSLNYKNELTTYKDETDEKRTYEIIVLLNENSASASEILAAALQESYGAKIVGEPSFGKGKVQQTMQLEDGSMVKYTSAYWLTPKGTCIDGVGIIPDYPISNENVIDEEGNIIGEKDNQLEQAKSILSR